MELVVLDPPVVEELLAVIGEEHPEDVVATFERREEPGEVLVDRRDLAVVAPDVALPQKWSGFERYSAWASMKWTQPRGVGRRPHDPLDDARIGIGRGG